MVAPPSWLNDEFAGGGATINVEYVGSWTPEAQNAFAYAVSIWEGVITSAVPIQVVAEWAPLGTNVLGSAGPHRVTRDFGGAPQAGTFYPIAIANGITGIDLHPEQDINARFSSNFSAWYFGTDGSPAIDEYDFVSVVLHELGHGLGFSGSMYLNNEGLGAWGLGTPPMPMVYDRFTENGAGQSLLNSGLYPNPSAALLGQLTSGNIYFDGGNAVAANGGTRPQLYAPGNWQSGSSYSHLDEGVFPRGTVNALMTPLIANGEANHNPGPVTLGIFADMGWVLAMPNTPPSLAGVPSQQLLVNQSIDNAIDLWTFAADAESTDEELTFAITSNPPANLGISLDSDRYIDINPATNATGQATVTVMVTDPEGESDTAEFVVAVTNQNPTLSNLPDQYVTVNFTNTAAIDLWVYADDLEFADEALSFHIANTPAVEAGVFLTGSHTVAISPTLDWMGQTTVTIQVSDPAGGTAVDDFFVYVTTAGNTVPTMAALPDLELNVNTTDTAAIDLWAYVSDGESALDELVYTIENSPAAEAGVTLVGNRYVSVEPVAEWTGTTVVRVQVEDDGGLVAWRAFTLRVTRPAYLPVLLKP